MNLDPELTAKCLALARTVNGVDVSQLTPTGGAIVPPPADCSESEFQAAFDRAARELGWELNYHTRNSRRSPEGFPDSVVGREWGTLRLFVAELKVPPNKPKPAQRRWLKLFETAGVPAYVFYPSDWPAILEVLRSA